MRQIAFDTETTGFEISEGHRIIEIGCVEIVDRQITGKTWHCYINPQRDSDEGALEVHGLTTEFLADKPLFHQVVDDFITFISGAEMIAHNASFDVAHLNNEFKLSGKSIGKLEDHCTIVDSLKLARSMFPGARATLDALCRRFQVDNSGRDLHGALIDSDLLAQVYLRMTGGQKGLQFDSAEAAVGSVEAVRQALASLRLPVLSANDAELADHQTYLQLLSKKSNRALDW